MDIQFPLIHIHNWYTCIHVRNKTVLPSQANTSYTNLNQQSDSQGISPLICCSTATKTSVTADPNPLNLIVYFS